MTIVFSTKTWQGDYPKYLQGSYQRKLAALNYPFTQKWFVINNIGDPVPDSAFESCGADLIFRSEKFADEVLDYFGISEADFKGGYWYSIAELTEIALCQQMGIDYICHFASDCMPHGSGVEKGVEKIQGKVITTSFNNENNTWHDATNQDQFFTDQAYILKVDAIDKDFFKQIKDMPDIREYPAHGGLSFEHMMAKYMRANDFKREIITEVSYGHEEW